MNERNTGTDLSRRDALRGLMGLGIGAVAGVAFLPVEIAASAVTEDTGHKTGNAGWDQYKKDSCKNNRNPQQCVTNWNWPNKDIKSAVFDAPLVEEGFFRGIPSFLTDATDKNIGFKDAYRKLNHGRERAKVSRRSAIVGTISSLAFGAAHNMTSTGFNNRTIPSSQIIAGGAFWVLARKYGITSSMAAHSASNGAVVMLSKMNRR